MSSPLAAGIVVLRTSCMRGHQGQEREERLPSGCRSRHETETVPEQQARLLPPRERAQPAVEPHRAVVKPVRRSRSRHRPGVPARRDVGPLAGVVVDEVLPEEPCAIVVVEVGRDRRRVIEDGESASRGIVAQDPMVVGVLAGQDGCSSGTADRKRRVVAFERDPLVGDQPLRLRHLVGVERRGVSSSRITTTLRTGWLGGATRSSKDRTDTCGGRSGGSTIHTPATAGVVASTATQVTQMSNTWWCCATD